MAITEERRKELCAIALRLAADSNCTKRKVGAVIVDGNNAIIGTGCNSHTASCECIPGKSDPIVVHAERAAINSVAWRGVHLVAPITIFCTHEPCNDCRAAIAAAPFKIVELEMVDSFMKFDQDKLRYELIPPLFMKRLAEFFTEHPEMAELRWDLLPLESIAEIVKILTDGAKKYKENNWKLVEDKDRYVGALMRHLMSYRNGEHLDSDSGSKHSGHFATNAIFLNYLDKGEENGTD